MELEWDAEQADTKLTRYGVSFARVLRLLLDLAKRNLYR
jgi:uncharacterized DUF497 family protein